MKGFLRYAIAVLLLFSFAVSPVIAQEKSDAKKAGEQKEEKAGKKGDEKKGEKAKKKKETYIKDKVKDFESYKGLFTIYQNPKDGQTYLEIQKDQVGKEFIYFSYIENGIVGAFSFRGQYRGSKTFSIQKHFNKIEFVEENTSYYFDPENALSRAKDANISKATLLSQKVEAEDSLKTAYLIKADPIFLAENVELVKPVYPKQFKGYRLGKRSKNKSKYVRIKSYPQNTDVVVEYVYENGSPDKSPGPGATDARFITVRVQHSILESPKNDYQPRYDDPRIGYFTTQVTDLTSHSPTPYRDLIHRWHLKKKNPGAAVSESVEPIVWWIENTTPKDIRGTIKDAVLSWNIAFEKAGFKNAVQVKIQPDDADWDAGDIRYNVLRWTSSPAPPFGGYGPSFVNPRTGQILGADVMLEYVFLTNRITAGKIFETALLDLDEPELPRGDHPYCMLNNNMQMNNLFGRTALNALGGDYKTHKELVKESIYYLMLHEVGHTLGLNHNMKATQLHSLSEISNKNLTKKTGLAGSVMDYPAINFAANGRKQGQFYTTRPGPYDIWAITYGYSPAVKNAKKERQRLNKILERSTEPALAFGNDADDMRSAGKALDPRVNTGDMSNDAVGFAIDQIKLTQSVSQNLRKKLAHDHRSYQELRNAYLIVTRQHSNSLRVISRYIGGVYVDRAFQGQTGETKPLRPVSKADQKRAMNALATYGFAPDAFDAPNDLFNYLLEQRRGFSHFGRTEDPKIHARVSRIQDAVLAHLLHPTVMERMTDTRLYGNEYPLAEMMDDLTAAIFDADMNGSVNDFRKNLQAEYVRRLIGIMGEKGNSRYDNISQGLAYFHLKNIRKRLKDADAADSGTMAHRTYLADLIDARFDDM